MCAYTNRGMILAVLKRYDMRFKFLISIIGVIVGLIVTLPAHAATVDVSITTGSGGFSPSTVNITAGDTVRWTNNDSVTRSVFSKNHPSHTLYSSLNLGNVAPGGTLQLTFNDVGTYGYHDHLYSSNLGTVVVAAAPEGTSTSGGSYIPPTVDLVQPNGGETLSVGTGYFIFWGAGGSDLKGIRISLSVDGGATFDTEVSANEYHDGAYLWTVPAIPSTTTGRIRLEVLGVGDVVLASDESNGDFEIIGIPPVIEDTADDETVPADTMTDVSSIPDPDPTVTGAYTASDASAATPTIEVDKGLGTATLVDPPCISETLIKGPQPAVYYCGRDGKRYVFPNQSVYYSWYADFDGVVTVTDESLAAVPLGGNVTYRPGVRLVKIQSDPKVYTVSRGGVLRWVQDEAMAAALYGADWSTMVDDVDPALFFQYSFGNPITEEDLP